MSESKGRKGPYLEKPENQRKSFLAEENNKHFLEKERKFESKYYFQDQIHYDKDGFGKDLQYYNLAKSEEASREFIQDQDEKFKFFSEYMNKKRNVKVQKNENISDFQICKASSYLDKKIQFEEFYDEDIFPYLKHHWINSVNEFNLEQFHLLIICCLSALSLKGKQFFNLFYEFTDFSKEFYMINILVNGYMKGIMIDDRILNENFKENQINSFVAIYKLIEKALFFEFQGLENISIEEMLFSTTMRPVFTYKSQHKEIYTILKDSINSKSAIICKSLNKYNTYYDFSVVGMLEGKSNENIVIVRSPFQDNHCFSEEILKKSLGFSKNVNLMLENEKKIQDFYFLELSDFQLLFKKLIICNSNDSNKFSSEKILNNLENGNINESVSNLFQLEIKVPGKYFISVINSHFGSSQVNPIKIIIGSIINENSQENSKIRYKYLDGKFMKKKISSLEYEFEEKGKYLIYVNIILEKPNVQNILYVNGPQEALIKDLSKSEQRILPYKFLRGAIKNTLREEMKCFTNFKGLYRESNFPMSDDVDFNGIGFIYFKNYSKTSFNIKLKTDRITKTEIDPPHKNIENNFIILPGKDQLILFHLDYNIDCQFITDEIVQEII